MEPPRIPLNAIKSTNAGIKGASIITLKNSSTSDINKPAGQEVSSAQLSKKLVPQDDMPAFRQAIEGNGHLSKIGLVEVLNKQFSKISKSTIKATLEIIAKRVGTKEVEKRWVLCDNVMT